jgi:hypothetical protein
MAVNYNIIDKSINTALDNFEISGGKTYIILLEAPTGANVRIRLDDNTADEIPLDTNYGLKFSKATRIYVSSDAVSGQAIKIGVSDTTTGEFEVLPSPTVDQIDTIGEVTELAGISTALNTALDKIINPYQVPTITTGDTNSTSDITLISKTLTCDKIICFLAIDELTSHYDTVSTGITLYIDGHAVCNTGKTIDATGYSSSNITLEGVRGKALLIKARTGGASRYAGYALNEYILKS